MKAKGLGSSSENLLSNSVDEMVGRSVETPKETPQSENKDVIQIKNGEVKHILIEKKSTQIEQDKENFSVQPDTPSLPSEQHTPEKPSLGTNLISGQGNDTVQNECKTLNTNVEKELKDSAPKEKELNSESSASDSIKIMETQDGLEHTENPELCNINETLGVEERDEMQQTESNGLNRIEEDSVAKPEVTPKHSAVESINGNTMDTTDEVK